MLSMALQVLKGNYANPKTFHFYLLFWSFCVDQIFITSGFKCFNFLKFSEYVVAIILYFYAHCLHSFFSVAKKDLTVVIGQSNFYVKIKSRILMSNFLPNVARIVAIVGLQILRPQLPIHKTMGRCKSCNLNDTRQTQ